MQSLSTILTIFSSAGIASIIGIIITAMDSSLGRNQHQKDVTVAEIKQARDKLKDYDTKYHAKDESLDDKFSIETKLIAYLGEWAVNLRYKRISRKMTKYALGPLLAEQYNILRDDIVVFGLDSRHAESTRHVIKLFWNCDIISTKEVVKLCLHVKKLKKLIGLKH